MLKRLSGAFLIYEVLMNEKDFLTLCKKQVARLNDTVNLSIVQLI